MKVKSLYILFVIPFVFLSIMGSSSGPTGMIGDRTGSPISGGFCNGCHDYTGRFQPTISIQLKDVNDNLVINGLYKPNETYKLSISIFAPPSNETPAVTPQYGAQAVVLKQSSPFVQAGLLSNPTTGVDGLGAGVHFYYLHGRTYLEHTERNSSGIFNVTWIAPSAGTGTVGIYAAGLAVNTNLAFTGDDFDSTFVLLQEDLSIGVEQIASNALDFKVFPNPSSTGQFSIDGLEGVVQLRVYDLVGREVYVKEVFVGDGAYLFNPNLPKGVYVVRVDQGDNRGQLLLLLE